KPVPALAITMSRPPNVPSAASTLARACAGSAASPATATPPISPATASIGPGRRPVTTTCAPSFANRRAVAAPIPVPPPLTIATLPSSRILAVPSETGLVCPTRPPSRNGRCTEGSGSMAHVEPLRREDLPELEELFRHYDETLSFVPNSLYTMARRPEILRAFSELITQIWNSGTLPKSLKPLIGIVSSVAAGCRYCQAHEAVDARMRDVPVEKISAIWDFERSPLYDEG